MSKIKELQDQVNMEAPVTEPEQMIKRERIEGTPFIMVCQNNDERYFLACGNWKVTEEYNREELLEMVERKDWLILVGLMSVVYEETAKIGITSTTNQTQQLS